MPGIYMPILKWKRGELDGLSHLYANERALTVPMLELLDGTIDTLAVSAAGAPTVYDRAADQAIRACKSSSFFVDATVLDGKHTGRVYAMALLFSSFRNAKLRAVPVARLDSSAAHIGALASIIAIDRRGCAVRLNHRDFESPTTLMTSLKSIILSLGVGSQEVDLVLDWGAVSTSAASAISLAASSLIPMLSGNLTWRSIVIAGSSFPHLLTAAGRGVSTILRAEWAAYKLVGAMPPTGQAVAFGDYAIAYPVYTTVRFAGAAGIRYTITDDWLILRGRSVSGPVHGGFGQFRTLCTQLMAHPSYCGRSFSWGDTYISDCSAGSVGTGNMTTWRAVGTNHHLTFVARQLSNHRAASTGLAPPPVGP